MSHSYYCLLGTVVDRNALFDAMPGKQCPKCQTEKTGNHCSNCGQKLISLQKLRLPCNQLSNSSKAEAENGCLAMWEYPFVTGYKTVVIKLHDDYEWQRLCHVYCVMESTGDVNYDAGKLTKVTADDITVAKEAIQSILQPMGLWDESKFGIWTVCQ